MLICPKCKKKLIRIDRSFVCEQGHGFDVARQGYLNLSLKQKKNQGDNRLMVEARSAFLEKGYYDFLQTSVQRKLEKYRIDSLVDGGCGQGYYTKAFSQVVTETYGIDLSKEAIRYAAVHDKKSQYLVSSLFDMPIDDASVDCVTSIFTPLAEKEVHRVLKKGGYWIIVGPAERHCIELKEQLYDSVYLNTVPNQNFTGFVCIEKETLSEKACVDDVWSLLEMTPYRYKTHPSALEKLKRIQVLETTFSFYIHVWRKV